MAGYLLSWGNRYSSRSSIALRSAMAVALLICFLHDPAWAFDFLEHRQLGTEAYRAACEAIRQELTDRGLATSPESVRHGLACRSGLDDVFGQACALAGDHVRSPEEITSAYGAMDAVSAINYLSLASMNVEHFQPASITTWARYQANATSLAGSAASGEAAGMLQFEKAFYTEAFAEHFLQDSFSAGHLGFNRAASSAASAKTFHDVFNKRGRTVVLANGTHCHALGDGYLNHPRMLEDGSCNPVPRSAAAIDPGGRLLRSYRGTIAAASYFAVAGMLRMYVLRSSPAPTDAAASSLVPDQLVTNLEEYWFERVSVGGESVDHRTDVESVRLIRAAPSYTASVGLGQTAKGGGSIYNTFTFLQIEQLTPVSWPFVHSFSLSALFGTDLAWPQAFSGGLNAEAMIYQSTNGMVTVGPLIGCLGVRNRVVDPKLGAVNVGPVGAVDIRFELGTWIVSTKVGVFEAFGRYLPPKLQIWGSVSLSYAFGTSTSAQMKGPRI